MDFLRAMCYRMHTPYAGAQEGGKHERTCEAFKRKKDRLSPVVDECNPGADDPDHHGPHAAAHLPEPGGPGGSPSRTAGKHHRIRTGQGGAVPSGRGRGTFGSNQLRLCPAGGWRSHRRPLAKREHRNQVSEAPPPHYRCAQRGRLGRGGILRRHRHGPGPGKTGPEHAGAYGPARLPGH